MATFALKTYQSETLDALREYLEAARVIGAQPAFAKMPRPSVRDNKPYHPLEGLHTVPYVCLRLPTGGGKTLLAAHTVKIAADAYLERERPMVLWLVPSNTIRAQILETLEKPGHLNYETLHEAFQGRVRVLDIADFANLTPSDLNSNACVIVATMQTLRVNEANTVARKVYAHNENLEPHFTAVPKHAAGLDRIEYGESKGQIKFSFRNLLALHRPLVIVDEAHNNTSRLSVEVLQRINAACVVEYTATPAEDSNILHNVSASELKAEEMIKLPIRLSEHTTWENAVRDSVLTRKRLHDLAAADSAYIRPIVLFQAEARNQDVTKEVLLKYLLEQEHIQREKIAVVTGDQKELDGINLFSPECPIDFVITVAALKEGWDCSFAYVFCSVATVHSPKDVEQLLGRVLRMPYAKRRKEAELNRAYAHVSQSSWPNAVQQLHDRLVDMGFEKHEADEFIEQTPEFDFGDGMADNLFVPPPPSTVIELTEDLSTLDFSSEERLTVRIEKTEQGSRVILTGSGTEAVLERVAGAVRSEEVRSQFQAGIQRQQAVWHRNAAPSARGVPFVVPQLCFEFDGALALAEPEEFGSFRGSTLLEYSAELSPAEFRLTETGAEWEIDLNASGRLIHTALGKAEQIDLDLVETDWPQSELCGWLEIRCHRPDVTQPVMLGFTRRAVAYLIETRAIGLSALVRWKFVLAKVLSQKIAQHSAAASERCYQQILFAPGAVVATSFEYSFPFAAEKYGPHWLYDGAYQFTKHFYSMVGELKGKGEEFDCARAIDLCPNVKHWVRNLERRGFALPLADRKFYPDFVVELEDGRILVIEHKGEIYATNDDSKDKVTVGELWASRSGGKAVFLMTVVGAGRPTLATQIEQIAATPRA